MLLWPTLHIGCSINCMQLSVLEAQVCLTFLVEDTHVWYHGVHVRATFNWHIDHMGKDGKTCDLHKIRRCMMQHGILYSTNPAEGIEDHRILGCYACMHACMLQSLPHHKYLLVSTSLAYIYNELHCLLQSITISILNAFFKIDLVQIPISSEYSQMPRKQIDLSSEFRTSGGSKLYSIDRYIIYYILYYISSFRL